MSQENSWQQLCKPLKLSDLFMAASITKNVRQFRCSPEEQELFNLARTYVRLGFGLQAIDREGKPISEPLYVQPAEQAKIV